jgi:hypothetical protein
VHLLYIPTHCLLLGLVRNCHFDKLAVDFIVSIFIILSLVFTPNFLYFFTNFFP